MFTLYRIGFCSVSKVAPVQCEQELMFCCGAEIVPKRSQCEQKPYPLCNLQRSLLIWKDSLPKLDSVAISAPIKVFRLDSDRLKNLSDTERSTFNSGAEQYCSGAENASKAAVLVWTEALSGTLSATLRFTIRYSVNIVSVCLKKKAFDISSFNRSAKTQNRSLIGYNHASKNFLLPYILINGRRRRLATTEQQQWLIGSIVNWDAQQNVSSSKIQSFLWKATPDSQKLCDALRFQFDIYQEQIAMRISCPNYVYSGLQTCYSC